MCRRLLPPLLLTLCAGLTPAARADDRPVVGLVPRATRPITLDGKVTKTTAGARTTLEASGFVLWRGSWELSALPAGTYTLELAALDRDGKPVVARSARVVHGEAPARVGQNPSPMVEHARGHPRLKEEQPEGRRAKLSTGTLFVPAGLKGERVPLLVHFHGAPALAEVAAAKYGKAAVRAPVPASG